MNALDFVVVAAMIAAGYFGYRLGFVARVVSWAGLAVGIVLAVAFVDDVTGLLSSQASQTKLFVAVAFFLLLATGGQAAGYAAGIALRGVRIAGQPPGLAVQDGSARVRIVVGLKLDRVSRGGLRVGVGGQRIEGTWSGGWLC